MSILFEKIIKLRKEGKTYRQIQKELGCAKSTISYHCQLHKLGGFSNNLSDDAKANIYNI